MIEAVLFDMGDTFVHVATSQLNKLLVAAARPAWERLCALGFRPPRLPSYLRQLKWTVIREIVWSHVRRREARLTSALHRRHRRMGLDLAPEVWLDVLSRCIPPLRQHFEADKEAAAVLAKIHGRGIKLGIVSNTVFPALAIDDVLACDGLLQWFAVRVYSSEVGYRKPHPKIFQAALDQLGVRAERTVFVGDRVDKDVKGASRLGMKTVLIARNGKPPVGRCRPDHTIQRLSQLLPLLEG